VALFALGSSAQFGVPLVKNDLQEDYVASYRECEASEPGVAEHIRKLPMSFSNQKNLSELTNERHVRTARRRSTYSAISFRS
jgi:ATP-binding cassette subfamily B protein